MVVFHSEIFDVPCSLVVVFHSKIFDVLCSLVVVFHSETASLPCDVSSVFFSCEEILTLSEFLSFFCPEVNDSWTYDLSFCVLCLMVSSSHLQYIRCT